MSTTATITTTRELLEAIGPNGATFPDADRDLVAMLHEAKAQGLVRSAMTWSQLWGDQTTWRLTTAGLEALDTPDADNEEATNETTDADAEPTDSPDDPPVDAADTVDDTETPEDVPEPIAPAPTDPGIGADDLAPEPAAAEGHADLIAAARAAVLSSSTVEDLRAAIAPAVALARLHQLTGEGTRTVLAFTKRNVTRWSRDPQQFMLRGIENS